jgi:predicted nucleic acid-binding protein
MPRRGQPLEMVSVSPPSRQLDTWIAFRRSCVSFQRHRSFPTWRNLVLDYKVSGIQVHDARIVAAMMVHRVDQILTFDLDDFKRYGGITVIHPADVK